MEGRCANYFALCFVLAISLLIGASPRGLRAESCQVLVLESTDDYMTLEFRCGPPMHDRTSLNGNRYDTLDVAGCESIGVPGKPNLPFYGFLIAAPYPCEPSVSLKSAVEDTLFGYNIAPSEDVVFVETDGDVMIERLPALDESLYRTNAYYPEEAIEAEFFGILRGQPLIRIKAYPARFNPVMGTVNVISEAVFKVYFTNRPSMDWPEVAGVSEGNSGPSFAMSNMVRSCVVNPTDVRTAQVPDYGSRPSTIALEPGAEQCKIAIQDDGIYKITGAELTAAGVTISTIDPEGVCMSHLGQNMAIIVADGGDGTFDTDDYLVFFAESIKSEYTKENIYWLSFDEETAPRMQSVNVTPHGASQPETYPHNLHLESDESYYQKMPYPECVGVDHWFWTKTTAPDISSFPFNIQNVAAGDYVAEIQIAMWGFTDTSDDPDHHTRIYLNDVLIDDQTWNGRIEFEHNVTGPQSLLINGDNVLKVEYVGDLSLVDTVFLNYISIRYQAAFVAQQDSIVFEAGLDGRYEFHISGFSSDDLLVLDITDPLAVKSLGDFAVQADGGTFTVIFEDDVSLESEYMVVTSSQLMTEPPIALDRPSSLKSSANHADLIIIAHENYIEASEEIAQHHIAKAEPTMLVDVQDIYDEFNFGVKDPAAIRDFLSYAYFNFEAPAPCDVLLVGDANIDYKNNVSTGTDFIPTHLFESAHSKHIGQTPSDNWFVCIDGSDILPDMNIGRICAGSSRDVETAMAKMLAYDNGEASGDWLYDVLFVADSTPEATTLSYRLAGYLPTEYNDLHINSGDYSSGADAKPDIISAVSDGCLILCYAGHGMINKWAENMLKTRDIASMSNGDKLPFAMMLNCLNGYFPDWTYTSCMGEVLVNSASKGALACWAPTSVDAPSNHRILAEEFFESVFYDHNCYLGAATTVAKVRAYARAGYSSSFYDIVETFELFGNPAISLAVPTKPAGPRLWTWTDKSVYLGGSTINVDVMLENMGEAQEADAYLAVDVQGTLLFFPYWTPEPTPIGVYLPEIVKMKLRATSIRLPDEPATGYYTFYAGLTAPGDMSQLLGIISTAYFEIR
ncbi:hypothetical protein J7M28_02760 [bacterium]|nr:hypothetical protein [bacterium]